MEELLRLRNLIKHRAIQGPIGRGQSCALGDLIPVNEVLGLLYMLEENSLKEHLDKIDNLMPDRLKSTTIPDTN